MAPLGAPSPFLGHSSGRKIMTKSDKKSKRAAALAVDQASVRLLNRAAVVQITGLSYPTIWKRMREGQFPRSHVIGAGANSKSVWYSDEIADWLDALPVRPLKGDPPPEAA
jgi:predicted DNA-binding transcriptional regulator AlpA